MMKENYWLKFGQTEQGKFVCIRTLSATEPCKDFFYDDNGAKRKVLQPHVVMLNREILESIKV